MYRRFVILIFFFIVEPSGGLKVGGFLVGGLPCI